MPNFYDICVFNLDGCCCHISHLLIQPIIWRDCCFNVVQIICKRSNTLAEMLPLTKSPYHAFSVLYKRFPDFWVLLPIVIIKDGWLLNNIGKCTLLFIIFLHSLWSLGLSFFTLHIKLVVNKVLWFGIWNKITDGTGVACPAINQEFCFQSWLEQRLLILASDTVKFMFGKQWKLTAIYIKMCTYFNEIKKELIVMENDNN